MFRSIIVSCDRTEATAGRVALAVGLTQRYQARLIGRAAKIIEVPIYSGHSVIALTDLEEGSLGEIEQVRCSFDRESRALDRSGWHQALDDPTNTLLRHSRAADLIVIGRKADEDPFDHQMGADPGEVILGAGRPVLVAPPTATMCAAKTVSIAWKDTREARRAVRDALPFLRSAERVHVIEISAEPAAPVAASDVCDWLALHDIEAEAHAFQASVSEGLEFLDRASRFGADLIVAGGYGRSRLREYIFGGFTRELLENADVCSLFSN